MKAKFIALAAVLSIGGAMVAAGCGGDEKQPTASAQSSTQTDSGSKESSSAQDAGTESGASELRAGLTSLLQEHVYLAGTAISQGVGAGLDSKEFKASAGVLDENSVALSEAIGGVYGDAAGEQFLALWRDHITFFVDYTKAKAAGDKKAVKAARKKLDGYRAEFGAFIASANPNLSEEAVASELKPHVNSLFTTIDAVVAGSPSVFEKLQKAAAHMPGTANVLAGAIAQQFPDKFGA